MKSIATIGNSGLKGPAPRGKDTVTTTLSIAATLTDAAYPERGVVGWTILTLFSLDQDRVVDQQPVNRTSGLFAYSNLANGNYRLNVESEFYFEAVATVKVSNNSFINFKPVEIPLFPKPFYPYPAGATLLSGAVRTGAALLGGVRIAATYRPEGQGHGAPIERTAETRTVESGPYQGYYTLSFGTGESSRLRAIEATLALSKEGYESKQERLTLPARQDTRRDFAMETR